MKDKVILVDLDGTFCLCNTFHCWVFFLLKSSITQLNFLKIILRISFLLACRKLGFIDHSSLKKSIQELWSSSFTLNKKKKLLDDFVLNLEKYRSKFVFDALSVLEKESVCTVLATAAPVEYASLIVSRESLFDAVLATPLSSDTKWFDNIKEAKKNSVLNFFKESGVNPDKIVLFTDHLDDLPLVVLSDVVYLLPPISNEIGLLAKMYPKKEFIVDC